MVASVRLPLWPRSGEWGMRVDTWGRGDVSVGGAGPCALACTWGVRLGGAPATRQHVQLSEGVHGLQLFSLLCTFSSAAWGVERGTL